MLALGVLSAPRSVQRRGHARATWMSDAAIVSGRVIVRFVIGGLSASCLSDDVHAEGQRHRDLTFVRTHDCRMWHTPEKTHIWFKEALKAFPEVPWVGKTEDDAMIWPTVILADLAAVSPSTEWYGQMHWQGSCLFGFASSMSDCAGCYGGAMWQGPAMCRPAWCQGEADKKCCQLGCAHTGRMAPFALGALDVRRRPFAAAIASCAYADRYFSQVSAHSASLNAMCVTTDGSQGHAVGECVGSVRVADATSRHQDGTRGCDQRAASRCARGQVAVLHPLKKNARASWNASWAHLAGQHAFVPQPLIEARVDALGGQHAAAFDSGDETHLTSRTTLPPARYPSHHELQSRPDLPPARSLPPRLVYVGELQGRYEMPSGHSVERAWARRAASLNAQLKLSGRSQGHDFPTQYRGRNEATVTWRSSARQQAGGLRRGFELRRRRLRQYALWSTNCTLQWSQGREAVLEQFARAKREGVALPN